MIVTKTTIVITEMTMKVTITMTVTMKMTMLMIITLIMNNDNPKIINYKHILYGPAIMTK